MMKLCKESKGPFWKGPYIHEANNIIRVFPHNSRLKPKCLMQNKKMYTLINRDYLNRTCFAEPVSSTSLPAEVVISKVLWILSSKFKVLFSIKEASDLLETSSNSWVNFSDPCSRDKLLLTVVVHSNHFGEFSRRAQPSITDTNLSWWRKPKIQNACYID